MQFRKIIFVAFASCIILSLTAVSRPGLSEPPEIFQPATKTRKDGSPHLFYGGLGRYQLTAVMLQQIGMLKADHRNWTSKYGVGSSIEFLQTPVAQEKALEDVMSEIERHLRHRGAMSWAGAVINSPHGNFRVTEGGLLAAAHAEGTGTVTTFLRLVKEQGGSVPRNYANAHRAIAFGKIESRLRDFVGIEHRAKP